MAKSDPLAKRMRDEYQRIKEEINRRPTRLEMYHPSDILIREYLKQGWLAYLKRTGDLTMEEENWLGTPVEDFLLDIEKTSMSKAYKMPTIASLLEAGNINKKVSLQEIGQNFMDFYVNNPVHQRTLGIRATETGAVGISINLLSWPEGTLSTSYLRAAISFTMMR